MQPEISIASDNGYLPSGHGLWSDQSNTTLRKADSEYKGQRSILGITRSKITSLTRQDSIDRYYDLFSRLNFVLVRMILVRGDNLFFNISICKRTGFRTRNEYF